MVPPPVSPRRYLREILEDLSKKHDLPFKEVRFKNQRSLWGSCSGKNNINLNLRLATIPKELCEYVILHELVHTKHKNHGRSFWNEILKLEPKAKILDRMLRKYR